MAVGGDLVLDLDAAIFQAVDFETLAGDRRDLAGQKAALPAP